MGRSRKALEEMNDFMEKNFSPAVHKELNKVKKTEIDRLRRKSLIKKKGVEYKDDSGHISTDPINLIEHKHLDTEHELTFSAEDIFLLHKASKDHYEKYDKMRKEDFKRYEMEKKFLSHQKARHIKDEQKRKEFLEQAEKEKAEYEAAKKKEKAPLTKAEVKKVWTDKDELPEKEFNPKTFFALHDVDSDGMLDLDEIRMLVAYEVDRTFNGTKADKREKIEEMEKMRKYLYKTLDKNQDFVIDFDEFMEQYDDVIDEDEDEHDDDWKDTEDDVDYNDEEFAKFEEEEINRIRDDFANGENPDGYDFEDVPLLDGNFINETHVKVGNETFKANDAPRDKRDEAFKKYEMEKKFEKEHEIEDMDLDDYEKHKLKEKLDTKYYNPSEDDIHLEDINKPFSPEELETVWEEQDHKTKKEFNLTKMFHLHDVNQDSFIDGMELRMMLATQVEKMNKDLDDYEKAQELEKLLEMAREMADTNKDEKISMEEFLNAAKKQIEDYNLTKDNKDARKLENKKYWEKLHKETKFTDEEYMAFSEKRTLDIRKLIANGIIPENYNYSHVPLLQGNFINSTHIQRGSDLIEIHEQTDEQRNADFKKFKMSKRFEFEEKLSHMTPEERDAEKEKLKKQREEWKHKMEKLNEPLSKKQVHEVWEEEDHMEKEEYSDDKFFRIHDVNEDGKLDKQEVRQILLRELAKAYNKKDKKYSEEEKLQKLESWTKEVYKSYDTNKDGNITLKEFKENEIEKSAEEEEDAEYTEEEYEKYKAKSERQ